MDRTLICPQRTIVPIRANLLKCLGPAEAAKNVHRIVHGRRTGNSSPQLHAQTSTTGLGVRRPPPERSRHFQSGGARGAPNRVRWGQRGPIRKPQSESSGANRPGQPDVLLGSDGGAPATAIEVEGAGAGAGAGAVQPGGIGNANGTAGGPALIGGEGSAGLKLTSPSSIARATNALYWSSRMPLVLRSWCL